MEYSKFDDARRKHLELVQGVITRLAGNGFQIKGWSVALTTALVALAGATKTPWLAFLGLVPAFLLGGLDQYFLWQERFYRRLYRELTLDQPTWTIAPFSLDLPPDLPRAVVAEFAEKKKPNTVGFFHGTIAAVASVVGAVGTWALDSPAPAPDAMMGHTWNITMSAPSGAATPVVPTAAIVSPVVAMPAAPVSAIVPPPALPSLPAGTIGPPSGASRPPSGP